MTNGKSRKGFTLIATSVGALLACSAAQAATLQVCSTCAQRTIQGAIDQAASGDTIQIASGVYNERISIIAKALTLRGNAGTTEVRASSTGPTVVLGPASGSTNLLVTIDGLNFTNGTHSGGTGIGGGIQVRQGAYLHLTNSVVTGNSANQGGGIGVNTPGAPPTTIDNSTITNNHATDGGGIYVAGGSSVIVTGTTVSGNTAGARQINGNGGGIFNAANGTLELEQTSVSHNSAVNGAGVFADLNSHGTTIAQSTITENTGTEACSRQLQGCSGVQGIGLWLGSDFSISDSAISHNSATAQEGVLGSGMYVFAMPGGKAAISGAVIGFNSGSGSFAEGAGMFVTAVDPSARVVLNDVYVINNQASAGFAGGIQNGATLVTTDVTLKDNTGANCTGGTGCP